MTTITNNKLTDETLSAWKAEAKISLGETAKDTPEYSHHAAIFELVTELQERRRADNAEPVSFDDLRDAVAEMTGGPAMQWGDIHKGHQPVPFINFNSLARIVDKFRVAPPAPVVPEDENGQPAGFAKWANRNFATNPVGTMTLSYCEDAWRAALLQGSQPVSNRDELPFDQWLSQQNGKIDVDCGCVTTEAFFHWLRVAYESGNELLPSIKPAPELDSVAINAKSLPSNSPVIPDDVLSAVRKVACIRADFDDFDGDRRGIGDCLDEAEQDLIVTINKHASVIAAAPQQEVN